MSTAVEVLNLDALFDLVKKIHAAHLLEGAQSIIIDLEMDNLEVKLKTLFFI